MFQKKLLLFFCINIVVCSSVQSQQLPDSIRQLVFAARLHSGFIFAHSVHVQNTKGIHPNGFELELSNQRTDAATIAKFKCYPRTGISFTYVDYNSQLLGHSYTVSYFLEPNYRLGNNLRMNFRAAAGFSYFTNPYNAVKNPTNQSYSTHINTFLQLGLGLVYPLSRHVTVYAMGNFFHDSNGGFKLPNAGVNYINASVGLQYYRYSTKLPVYKKVKDTSWRNHSFHINASVYYSPKSGYNADSAAARKFLLGTVVQIAKRVGNLDAITAAAEIYYDNALRSIKRTYVLDSSSSNVMAGLLVGHQFLLNRFTFSQEMGVYVFKQTKRYDNEYQNLFHTLYQRYGLTYHVKGRWSIGISLLAHKQVADFIDGRGVYQLK